MQGKIYPLVMVFGIEHYAFHYCAENSSSEVNRELTWNHRVVI